MTIDAFRYALNQVTPPPGRALWLYGDPALAEGDAYHPLKHKAEALRQKGCEVFSDIQEIGRDYDAVFVNCPKQREEAEGLLALALDRSRGFVMAAAANDAGGGRLQEMLEAYGAAAGKLSKDKCRIVWTMKAGAANKTLIEKNLSHLAMHQMQLEDEKFWTLPGLFAWDKLDAGSKLLLQQLPSDLKGRLADFGCGYGYLSTKLAKNDAIETIDAYDVDARAVACCARNGGGKVKAQWEDLRMFAPKPLYDAVVMNPPFHSGKQEDVELGKIFIQKAWQSLKPRGRIFVVANRHLPYEKVLPQMSKLFEDQSYKILTARNA